MDAQEGGAPAWLFSFVDLAFLMLIAMTQLADDMGAAAPDLGEMIVPSIGEDGVPGELAMEARRVWQLRIHPPELADVGPFELIAPASEGADDAPPTRLTQESLEEELDALFSGGLAKPLLVPHQDSRSQDLLDAVAIMEKRWPSRRRALVARIAEI